MRVCFLFFTDNVDIANVTERVRKFPNETANGYLKRARACAGGSGTDLDTSATGDEATPGSTES